MQPRSPPWKSSNQTSHTDSQKSFSFVLLCSSESLSSHNAVNTKQRSANAFGAQKKKKTTNIPGIKIICFHGVLVKGEKLFPLREAMREGTRGKEGETH